MGLHRHMHTHSCVSTTYMLTYTTHIHEDKGGRKSKDLQSRRGGEQPGPLRAQQLGVVGLAERAKVLVDNSQDL